MASKDWGFVRVNKQLLNRFRKVAKSIDRPMSKIVHELISEWLETRVSSCSEWGRDGMNNPEQRFDPALVMEV